MSEYNLENKDDQVVRKQKDTGFQQQQKKTTRMREKSKECYF